MAMAGGADRTPDHSPAGENKVARAGSHRTGVVVIGGPTASGKSEIALQIAREFGGVVINADSMQVYQELRILTARPDDAAISQAPHRLYGVLSAAERCSAGRWRQMAERAIDDAVEEGLLPIVVGGTGLYLKCLLEGIAPIPDVPPDVVAETAAWVDDVGLTAGRAHLATVDPETAERLQVIDRQRLIRALSVRSQTGEPLSWWARQPGDPIPHDAFTLAVLPVRAALYRKIDERFAWMVDRGAVDEARALGEMNLDPSLPAMKAVGVSAILSHLRGEISRTAMIDQGQTATRQYAKRQFTWFRRQYRSPNVVIEQFSKSIRDEMFKKIRQNLLTR